MGGNNSAFFKARDERDRKFFMAGMEMGVQLAHDYIQVALREPKTMGKDIFGRARIAKLFGRVQELDEYFNPAFSKSVEADKFRDELDKCLEEIRKEDLVPFEKRYPYANKFRYDKPMKGWVK